MIVTRVRVRSVFVGDKGLAYAKREGGLAYRDFGTGAETIVPVNTSFLWSVLRPSDVARAGCRAPTCWSAWGLPAAR